MPPTSHPPTRQYDSPATATDAFTTTAVKAGSSRTTVVILGTDAVLAARPATAVQLAHACLAAGYTRVVPASWGDELVAAGCIQELARRGPLPAVCCSCPRVAARLSGAGPELARALLPLTPPPVATARYLRRLAEPEALHVTYVGNCPLDLYEGEVDVQITPVELLLSLAGRGIRVEEQPTVFDGVLPPDRRRHLSLPGGIPSREAMAAHALPHRLVEIHGDSYAADLAELLLTGEPLLLDISARMGCTCSGAVPGMQPVEARATVMALEPPRSVLPVVELSLGVDVQGILPPPTPPREQRATVPQVDQGERSTRSRPTPPQLRAVTGSTRRTPVSVPRMWTGAFPRARVDDGQLLPRAYVARRHSIPRLAAVVPTATGGDIATPTATPSAGHEFESFVADMSAVVIQHVSAGGSWQDRLDMAIEGWRGRGYQTAVLERARALHSAPDVDGLLLTFDAAVDHLSRLEALAATIVPSLRGAPIFRDPLSVEAAEELVDRVFASGE